MENNSPLSPKSLPKSHLLALGTLALAVLVLPLAVVAAQLTTNLSSKAYTPPTEKPTSTITTPKELPSSPPALPLVPACGTSIKKFAFLSTCNPKTPPRTTEQVKVMPADSGTPSANNLTKSPTTLTNMGINFTCSDGFVQNYQVKTCTSQDTLKKYAEDACNSHLLTNKVYLRRCAIKPPVVNKETIARTATQPTTPTSGLGANSITFTCPDGFTSTYQPTASCTLQTTLDIYANKVCLSHRTCPAVSNITPVITTTSLVSGSVGKSYSASVTATDANPGDALIMAITGLPAGLQNGPCAVPSIGGTITCYFSGTPTVGGDFRLTVKVTDKLGSSVSKTLLLSIAKQVITTNTTPVITTTTLLSGITGQSYYTSISAKDADTGDVLNMIISGLPAGIKQGPCAVPSIGGTITCYISGFPTVNGPFNVSVKVTDKAGASTSKIFLLSISPTKTI